MNNFSVRIGLLTVHSIGTCFMISVLLLTGCHSIPLALTSTATSTLTPSSTLTPTPTRVPFLTLQNADVEHPDGSYQLDPAFSNIPSGTYVIFQYDNDYKYLSVDGSRQGNIGKRRYFPYANDYDHLYAGVGSFTSDFSDPEYMGASAIGKTDIVDGYKIYPLTEMTILSVKVRSGEQHVWKGVFPAESGEICTSIALSPKHTWIAVNCQEDDEYYVALLNIQQGTTKLLHPTSPLCTPGTTGLGIENWSPDEKWFSATCYAESSKQSCLISVETGNYYCQREGEVLTPMAWSPDGSKVAIYDEGDLLVTSRSCLMDRQACPAYIRAPVPQILGGAVFDQSGNIVIWTNEDWGLGYENPTTVYVGDLTTGEYTSFITRPSRVIDISPDGKLIAIDTDEGVMLLSLAGQFVSRLPTSDDNHYIVWEGWLVVP